MAAQRDNDGMFLVYVLMFYLQLQILLVLFFLIFFIYRRCTAALLFGPEIHDKSVTSVISLLAS